MRKWAVQVDAGQRDSLVERLAARVGPVQLVRGPSGIGKTTLASAVTRELAADGVSILPVVAVRELRHVPLAAMAPLLALSTDDARLPTADRIQRLFAIVGAEAGRRVLAIDDAPLLDDVSASTLYQLIRVYGLRCLMTARSDEPFAGPLSRLIDEGYVETTEVGSLTQRQIGDTAAAFLGDRLEPESLRRITRLSGGNPMFLREIVLAAGRRGDIQATPLGLSIDSRHLPPGVRDAIAVRLGSLDARERDVVELLAVAEPLPAEGIGAGSAVAALLDGEIAVTAPDGLHLAHPLFAEVVMAGLTGGELDARRIQAAELLGVPEREDERFALVNLLSATSRPPDVAELAWASRYAQALDDFTTALRLADRAIELEPGFEALLARATSLSGLAGMTEDAELAFARTQQAARDDDDRAAVAIQRGYLYALRLNAPAEARRILVAAAEETASPTLRETLEVHVARWSVFLGADPGPLDGMRDSSDPAVAIQVAVLEATHAAFAADLPRVRAAVARGRAFAGSMTVEAPHAQTLLDLAETFLRVYEGGGNEARRRALERTHDDTDPATGVWWYVAALVDLYAGRIEEAGEEAGRAVERLRWIDFVGLLGSAVALRAAAEAQLGRVDSARALLGELTDAVRDSANATTLVAEAETWLLARAGDLDGAMARLSGAVDGTLAEGLYGITGALARVATQLGRPEVVLAALERSKREAPVPQIIAAAEHAAALAGGSPDRLLTVSSVLGAVGQPGAATAAATSAARLFRAAHRREDERRAARLATAWGAQSSVVTDLAGRDPGTELTPREIDIARAAAGRERSREIAERLGLSVRTVENHLASVYRKLGVASRDELRAELGDTLRSRWDAP